MAQFQAVQSAVLNWTEAACLELLVASKMVLIYEAVPYESSLAPRRDGKSIHSF